MATLKQRVDLKTNGENLLSEDNYCTKFDNFQAMWSKDIERSKFVQTPSLTLTFVCNGSKVEGTTDSVLWRHNIFV